MCISDSANRITRRISKKFELVPSILFIFVIEFLFTNQLNFVTKAFARRQNLRIESLKRNQINWRASLAERPSRVDSLSVGEPSPALAASRSEPWILHWNCGPEIRVSKFKSRSRSRSQSLDFALHFSFWPISRMHHLALHMPRAWSRETHCLYFVMKLHC